MGEDMNQTRKLALGLGAAVALLTGGIALGAPALAQSDPVDPAIPDTYTYECPLDRDQVRHQSRQWMHESRDGHGTGPGVMGDMMHHRGHGPGDGTCGLVPDGADTDG